NRNAIGFERSPNIGQLLRQIARHLTSVGFVTSVLNFLECLSLQVEPAYGRNLASLLVAKGGGGHIEDCGQVFWREVIAQLPKHVDENVSRSRGQPGFSRHSSLPRHGVIRAKNKRHGINQKDAAAVCDSEYRPGARLRLRLCRNGSAFGECG